MDQKKPENACKKKFGPERVRLAPTARSVCRLIKRSIILQDHDYFSDIKYEARFVLGQDDTSDAALIHRKTISGAPFALIDPLNHFDEDFAGSPDSVISFETTKGSVYVTRVFCLSGSCSRV